MSTASALGLCESSVRYTNHLPLDSREINVNRLRIGASWTLCVTSEIERQNHDHVNTLTRPERNIERNLTLNIRPSTACA